MTALGRIHNAVIVIRRPKWVHLRTSEARSRTPAICPDGPQELGAVRRILTRACANWAELRWDTDPEECATLPRGTCELRGALVPRARPAHSSLNELPRRVDRGETGGGARGLDPAAARQPAAAPSEVAPRLGRLPGLVPRPRAECGDPLRHPRVLTAKVGRPLSPGARSLPTNCRAIAGGSSPATGTSVRSRPASPRSALLLMRTRSSAGCSFRAPSRGRRLARASPQPSRWPPTTPSWSRRNSRLSEGRPLRTNPDHPCRACLQRPEGRQVSRACRQWCGATDHHGRRRPPRPSSLPRDRYSHSGALPRPLTGRGADISVIDDPLKPEEALSQTQRQAMNEWAAVARPQCGRGLAPRTRAAPRSDAEPPSVVARNLRGVRFNAAYPDGIRAVLACRRCGTS